jgi:hypothetical protein
MVKGCRHIMPNGLLCKSPALRERSYCYFHQNLHAVTHAAKQKKRQDRTFEIGSIEDAAGIQIALTQVADAMASSRINRREAGTMLYGLHLASSLAKQRAAFDPSQTVRNVCHGSDGTLMAAPEESGELSSD